MLENEPPTYTVVPSIASPSTGLFAAGLKPVATAVAMSIAAARLRFCPAMIEKSPPT